ncbi:STAS domain-containing protein [Streptomyces sp. NPDC058691]|uniref:STAS domain-containing protein n=1 Tax=Streptomyces sp. NPDC058691 TaxID=3346601 RepID=UPI00366762F7
MGGGTPHECLRENTRAGAGADVVPLHGEIDLISAPLVAARLDALSAAPCPDLVVDLREVDFIDCSGLRVLCRTLRRVRQRGGTLRLIVGDGPVLAALRLADLHHAFDVRSGMTEGVTRHEGLGLPRTGTGGLAGCA